MPNINRRFFLTSVAKFVGSGVLLGGCSVTPKSYGNTKVSFSEGVASGDPLSDRVILWTRLTPQLKGENKARLTFDEVTWQIAKDQDFGNIVNQGVTSTSSDNDFCAKVDAQGLESGTKYFYRFLHGDDISPIGRTKTLPETDAKEARFAVVSCSNYGHGYFHVYGEIARRDDLDFVLHLGDYIYEYQDDVYSDPDLIANDRLIEPKHEILSLDDYRARYRCYRNDTNLQAVHASLPFIAVWDDHEIANDAWIEGAEGHQQDEGDWAKRKMNALKAYREYMPIRDPEQGSDPLRIYRRFDIGDLASLIMLDTRLIGREEPVNYRHDIIDKTVSFDVSDSANPTLIEDSHYAANLAHKEIKTFKLPFDFSTEPPTPITDWARLNSIDPGALPKSLKYLPDANRTKLEKLEDPNRDLLGKDQESWLNEQLIDSKNSGHTWQIIGQQILTGQVCMPNIADIAAPRDEGHKAFMDAVIMLGKLDLPLNMDAWDGYNVAKQRVLNSYKNNANNVISLAGDTHNAWAFELTPDNENTPVAVEFGTPSISSPGLESYLPTTDNKTAANRMIERNQELVFHDNEQRGWLEVRLERTQAQSRFHFISSVKTQKYKMHKGPTFTVKAGTNKLVSST